MKAILLLVGVAATAVFGQSNAPRTQTGPQPVRGAFFALSVRDLEASTRWYSEKLDLKVAMRVPKAAKSAVTVLEGGGLIVELIEDEDAMPLSTAAPAVKDPRLIHGIFKAGFVVDDLEQAVTALRARGVEIAYGPFPARANQRSNVIIRDNAGNLIQLFGR